MSLFEQLALFRLDAAPGDTAGASKQRHVQLGSRIVTYRLRLGRSRRLSLTIDERGLAVAAPLRTSLRDIDAFIASHAAWVHRKLDEYAGQRAQRHLAVRDGVRLPLLGGEANVRIVAGANRVSWEGEALDQLLLKARPDADCDALARRALQRRAVEVFGARVTHFARLLQRPAPTLRLSSARTRWGSCSERSGIRLNWRLVHLPLALIDYVVAHELAHLVEMNHSPRFWAVVGSLYPDWRAARQQLKACAAQIPII